MLFKDYLGGGILSLLEWDSLSVDVVFPDLCPVPEYKLQICVSLSVDVMFPDLCPVPVYKLQICVSLSVDVVFPDLCPVP